MFIGGPVSKSTESLERPMVNKPGFLVTICRHEAGWKRKDEC